MMKMTGWVIAVAPLGVFGLMAKLVVGSGFGGMRHLALYGLTVLAALIIHAAVTLPLLVRTVVACRPCVICTSWRRLF